MMHSVRIIFHGFVLITIITYLPYIRFSISPYKIVLNYQMPFQNHKYIFYKKNGLEINLPTLYPDIRMYCHITSALVVWHISYEGTGDK